MTLAIICHERGIPSKRRSSICIDYVPALCTKEANAPFLVAQAAQLFMDQTFEKLEALSDTTLKAPMEKGGDEEEDES